MKIKLLNVLKENKMIQFAIDGPMITGQPLDCYNPIGRRKRFLP